MVRNPKIPFIPIGVILASLLLAVILCVLLTRPSDRVIWQSCQPEPVKYDSFNGYCLYVRESNLDWSRFPYTLHRRYYLVIGHVPSYGHYKEYSFSSVLEDIEIYIKKSELDWSEQGLTFKEKSGHHLFFPKESFLGGR